MKRTKSALIAVLTLIMTIASLHVVGLAEANYFPPPSIEIPSPISIRIYNESSVLLHVIVNALPSESSRITHISYCLDGKANVTLTNLTRKDGEAYWTSTPGVIVTGNAFGVKATLDNLSEGNHTLTVYSHAADGKEMSKSRDFTVDYDYVPRKTLLGCQITCQTALQRCHPQSPRDLKESKRRLPCQQQIYSSNPSKVVTYFS